MQFVFEGKIVPYSVQPRDKGNARIAFRWAGKAVFLTTGKAKEKDAAKAAPAVIEKWMKLEAARPKQVASPLGLPWAKAVEMYVEVRQAGNKPGTRAGVEQVLEDFGDLAGNPDLSTFDKDAFRKAYAALPRRFKPKTVANWHGILVSFAQFLVEEDHILRDFTLGTRAPGKEHFGTHEEIYHEDWFKLIWEKMELWARPRWEDHWYTGLDTSDLWEMQPRKHFIFSRDWTLIKLRAKEAKLIKLPFPPQIRARWVQRYNECGPEDFLYPDNRTLSPNAWGNRLLKHLHSVQRQLRLPLLDIKATRHTFMTRHVMRLVLGEKNAPQLMEIRDWVGHAPDSRILEEIYAKLSVRHEAMR